MFAKDVVPLVTSRAAVVIGHRGPFARFACSSVGKGGYRVIGGPGSLGAQGCGGNEEYGIICQSCSGNREYWGVCQGCIFVLIAWQNKAGFPSWL